MEPQKTTNQENSQLTTLKAHSVSLTQCIQKGDSMGVALIEKNLTIEKAMQGSCLVQVEKEIGEKNLIGIVMILIMKNVNFFNVGKNLTEDQAMETAALLLDEFKYETMEDFIMMFKMAKKGLLGNGQVYNRIDGNIILNWMKEYREKKVTVRENFHLDKKYEESKNQGSILALMEENEKPFDRDEFYEKGRLLDEERRRQEEEKKEQDRKERAIRRELYLKNAILQKEYEEQIEREHNKKDNS